MYSFKNIKDITFEGDHSSDIFITLDIDWAADDVLADSIDLIEAAGVAATWFVTHDTVLLDRLRDNDKFELGIHPNFNKLLAGDDDVADNATQIIEGMLEVVPEAVSVRSHSMTQNSVLLDLFKDKGLLHDCNTFVPYQSGVTLSPWKHWNGIMKVPYFWEDDVACIYENIDQYEQTLQTEGLKVYDFHPIHLFLNTETLSRYEDTRDIHRDASQLISHRNEVDIGSRDVLNWLLNEVSKCA